MHKKQADAVAKTVVDAIEEQSNKIATQNFIKLEIATLYNKLLLSMLAIAGISLTVVKLFFWTKSLV
ncbi:hypothetical protein SPBRAN_647 [uncultured Candidatus Thioglobus sp.]|nr:hypothetical protein SPBRAN_647 [uncultured Candidatus Thioglobus sp.]